MNEDGQGGRHVVQPAGCLADSLQPHDTVAVILARMEGKLDRLVDDKRDHETRIRALEKKVWAAAGAAAAAGGAIGVLGQSILGG